MARGNFINSFRSAIAAEEVELRKSAYNLIPTIIENSGGKMAHDVVVVLKERLLESQGLENSDEVLYAVALALPELPITAVADCKVLVDVVFGPLLLTDEQLVRDGATTALYEVIKGFLARDGAKSDSVGEILAEAFNTLYAPEKDAAPTPALSRSSQAHLLSIVIEFSKSGADAAIKCLNELVLPITDLKTIQPTVYRAAARHLGKVCLACHARGSAYLKTVSDDLMKAFENLLGHTEDLSIVPLTIEHSLEGVATVFFPVGATGHQNKLVDFITSWATSESWRVRHWIAKRIAQIARIVFGEDGTTCAPFKARMLSNVTSLLNDPLKEVRLTLLEHLVELMLPFGEATFFKDILTASTLERIKEDEMANTNKNKKVALAEACRLVASSGSVSAASAKALGGLLMTYLRDVQEKQAKFSTMPSDASENGKMLLAEPENLKTAEIAYSLLNSLSVSFCSQHVDKSVFMQLLADIATSSYWRLREAVAKQLEVFTTQKGSEELDRATKTWYALFTDLSSSVRSQAIKSVVSRNALPAVDTFVEKKVFSGSDARLKSFEMRIALVELAKAYILQRGGGAPNAAWNVLETEMGSNVDNVVFVVIEALADLKADPSAKELPKLSKLVSKASSLCVSDSGDVLEALKILS